MKIDSHWRYEKAYRETKFGYHSVYVHEYAEGSKLPTYISKDICDICPMRLKFVSAMLLHRKNNIAGGYSI